MLNYSYYCRRFKSEKCFQNNKSFAMDKFWDSKYFNSYLDEITRRKEKNVINVKKRKCKTNAPYKRATCLSVSTNSLKRKHL